MEVGKLETLFASDPVATERARLEREALDYLLAWHTEKDPSLRSAAWHRMIAAANDLVEFNSLHGNQK